MIIKSLQLKDFRNYERQSIVFDRGTNILYGDNAQGKTNILEAIYLCGTTRSHKGSRDREMIRFAQEEAHLCTVVEKGGMDRQLDLHLKKQGAKGIALDRIPLRRAGEAFGVLNLVVFSPEDLTMIKDGPAKRRHFLDLELSQVDRIYLDNLAKYNKVLKQRNQLLKDLTFRPDLESTLEIWDQQLAFFGSKIIRQRRAFLEELNGIVADIHRQITGGRESLTLIYEPSCEPEAFFEELARSQDKDKKYKTTTLGPHRDDICFLVNTVDIRRYGSQGQQRTSALSLKLAEIHLVRRRIHDSPVLLLDDVLSELDSKRQNYLLNHIRDIQTIITCTGLDEFVKNRFQINKVFYIENGVCKEDFCP